MTSEMAPVVFAAVAGVLALVCVAEFAVRWWIRTRGRHLLRFPGMRALCTVEPGLRMPSPVTYSVNSAGARGPEPSSGGERCFRVTLIGGSVAEAGLLSDDHCLVGMISYRLNQPAVLQGLGASSAHAQAFAASLVDTAALLDLMRATLPRLLRQDVILLLTGGSDFLRWLLEGAPAGRGASDLAPAEYLVQYPDMPFSLRSPALRHAAKRLAFGWLHWTVHRRVGQYPARERSARRTVERFEPPPGDPAGAAGRYRHHLGKLIELCRARAANVVVILPGFLAEGAPPRGEPDVRWFGRLGSPRASGAARFAATAEVARLFELARRVGKEVALAQQVPIVDLGEIEPSLRHYYDDAHLTAEGANQAAMLVLDRIQRIVAHSATVD